FPRPSRVMGYPKPAHQGSPKRNRKPRLSPPVRGFFLSTSFGNRLVNPCQSVSKVARPVTAGKPQEENGADLLATTSLRCGRSKLPKRNEQSKRLSCARTRWRRNRGRWVGA